MELGKSDVDGGGMYGWDGGYGWGVGDMGGGAEYDTFFEMGGRYRGVGLGMERAYYTLPLPNYVRISLANVLCSKAFIR